MPARSVTQRILHPEEPFGEAEAPIFVHVVEEVREADARNGGQPPAEPPGRRGGEPRRHGEEVLARQRLRRREAPPEPDERDPRSGRERDRAEADVAPQRDAPRHLREPDRDRIDTREPQLAAAASEREVEPPREIVAEVVPDGRLDPGERRGWEQAVAGGAGEEALRPRAGDEREPASAEALLRVSLERDAIHPQLVDTDRRTVHVHARNEEPGVVGQALLHGVAAVRERDPALAPDHLRDLRD